MQENVVAKGKIFELVQLPQSGGRIFEVARRAPGTRLIIADKTGQKVLLTREFRRELDDYDYRLPGGKVFDTLDEFENFRTSGADITEAAKTQAKAEGAQEAGIDIAELKLFKKSVLGTTVEWDLYVFEATQWQLHADGQQLDSPEEQGTTVDWYAYDKVEQMILDGNMQEERIALILLQWLKRQP